MSKMTKGYTRNKHCSLDNTQVVTTHNASILLKRRHFKKNFCSFILCWYEFTAFYCFYFSKRTGSRFFVKFATLFSYKLCQLSAVFTLFFQEGLEVPAYIRHHLLRQEKCFRMSCRTPKRFLKF